MRGACTYMWSTGAAQSKRNGSSLFSPGTQKKNEWISLNSIWKVALTIIRLMKSIPLLLLEYSTFEKKLSVIL